MDVPSSFFMISDECDSGYKNVRDKPRYIKHKEFVESLWAVYRPYADKNLLSDAKTHFQERFWEMYLGATFLNHGFTIDKGSNKGPEFFLSNLPQKIWIEAIAPGPGTGPDAYFLPRSQGNSPQAFTVPIDAIILRLRSAIEDKKKKYDGHVADNIIGPDDAYIIAVNSKRIDTIVLDSEIPSIVKSVYPFGDLVAVLDKTTHNIVDHYHDYRDNLKKKAGSDVSTSVFLNESYSGISAVIYSGVDCANKPTQMGADFVLVHNAMARNKLDCGTFRFGTEYWLENDILNYKDWSESSQ